MKLVLRGLFCWIPLIFALEHIGDKGDGIRISSGHLISVDVWGHFKKKPSCVQSKDLSNP